MRIRKATIEDLTLLSALFDQYRMFYNKESNIEEGKKFLSERIIKNESVIYVAEDDNKTLGGFIQLYPLFSSTRMKKLWLLNDLFVNENFRGKQISVALINKAKDLVRETNACQLSLETSKTNDIGNQLYPKTGFVLDQENNHYYWVE